MTRGTIKEQKGKQKYFTRVNIRHLIICPSSTGIFDTVNDFDLFLNIPVKSTHFHTDEQHNSD